MMYSLTISIPWEFLVILLVGFIADLIVRCE